MLKPEEIIIRPLVNEKSTALKETLNQYWFEVDAKASKDDVKQAVTKFFNVKVDTVRTSIVHGKTRRVGQSYGRYSIGRRQS